MTDVIKDEAVLATPPPTPTAAPAATVTNTVEIHGGKSVGIAIILTFLLGPLGMFYSTIWGAVIMMVISILAAMLTLGLSFLITWPICIIWAAIAAKGKPAKVVTTTT
jgi:hypothetical protein